MFKRHSVLYNHLKYNGIYGARYTLARKTNSIKYLSLVSSTVTLANLRLSAVNGGAVASGGAFVDFSAANVLTDYVGFKLRLTDSAGKSIYGYIKAAGTGETLSGSELITNGDFSLSTGWNLGAGWAIGGNILTGTATLASAWREVSAVSRGLYKGGFDLLTRTAGTTDAYCFGGKLFQPQSVPATYSGYRVYVTSLYFYIEALTSFSGTIDNATLKQVLTPSATGCTIVSTPGGATYNWTSQTSGFNYNDASGYTYSITHY